MHYVKWVTGFLKVDDQAIEISGIHVARRRNVRLTRYCTSGYLPLRSEWMSFRQGDDQRFTVHHLNRQRGITDRQCDESDGQTVLLYILKLLPNRQRTQSNIHVWKSFRESMENLDEHPVKAAISGSNGTHHQRSNFA